MTTPNGGQQGAAQAFGSLLGQGIPFGGQSTGQPQSQGAGASQPQQLDPQFLPVLAALAPVLLKAAEGIISGLNSPQGSQPQSAQPQSAQPQGVNPQFLPGLPFPPPFLPLPKPENVIRSIGTLFGLDAPQGTPQGATPQASTGGQPQLDPQFLPVLAALVPGLISAAPSIIGGLEGIIKSLNAQQGAPQGAQPQGAQSQGTQSQGVSPQFFPGFPIAPPPFMPKPENVIRSIGTLFGLDAPQGTPQTAMPQGAPQGQPQLDPQFFELVKFLPGLVEVVGDAVQRLSATQGQPSFAQPQGYTGGVGAGQSMAAGR